MYVMRMRTAIHGRGQLAYRIRGRGDGLLAIVRPSG